ncbi:anti-CBASS protein Acb1 family protein [Chroococcidiopsis sp.]|uniref:anti-CBASS protein Acb1 family protein n=1 Tax=Chroococcidiopsis sp. TaxID=3088168 RepID=UPI003F3021AD
MTSTEQHLDAGAFFSSLLGFGRADTDKLESFSVGSRQRLSPVELFELYETNTFLANVIDNLPDAAVQKWCVYEDDEEAKNIQSELDKIKPFISTAWKMARLVGWAVVLLLVDDGELDYSKPVNMRKIRSVEGYSVLIGGEAGEISVAQFDENPFSLTYGEPILFSTKGSQLVHVSRLLLFYGVKKLSRHFLTRSHSELGTSVIDRCIKEFRNFDVGNNAIASTLPDFNIDIFAIPGLAQLLAKQKDFANYMQGLALARSVLKVMLVEAGTGGQNAGGYQVLTRQYTGVKEILEYLKQIFAGATDLNHTMLFGESPDGQTSGRYQKESWSQYVANQQSTVIRPLLNTLINYCHAANGSVPTDWSLEFLSILELDEVDKADVELKQAQRIATLVEKMIVTPEEAARAIAEGIDISKAIDLKTREEERQALQTFPEGMTMVNNVNKKQVE